MDAGGAYSHSLHSGRLLAACNEQAGLSLLPAMLSVVLLHALGKVPLFCLLEPGVLRNSRSRMQLPQGMAGQDHGV